MKNEQHIEAKKLWKNFSRPYGIIVAMFKD